MASYPSILDQPLLGHNYTRVSYIQDISVVGGVGKKFVGHCHSVMHEYECRGSGGMLSQEIFFRSQVQSEIRQRLF